MDQLEKEIRRHQKLYDQGKPEISDAEFDQLIEKLRTQNPNSRVLLEIGTLATRLKFSHDVPMLSLDKTYNVEAVQKWASSIKGKFVVAPKYDGVSLSLIYAEGRLHSAVTRGDGAVGDDVTVKVLNMQLPHEIDTHIEGRVIVRGEVLFDVHQWSAELQNVFQLKAAEGSTSNPRNAAAGTLLAKRLDSYLLKCLNFVAYDMLAIDEDDHQFPLDMRLDFLDGVGFNVGKRLLVPASDVAGAVADMSEIDLPFETDGIVVKVNSFAQRKLLGATAHHPRWAIALKKQGETSTTVLTGVEWQVSRTGAVSPVGILEPVQLSGVTVTRVTLHNLDQIKTLDLRTPSTVEVTRRGGVIPHVERMLAYSMSAKKIKAPKRCPCCSEVLIRDGATVRCLNTEGCEDQVVGRITYWCREIGMLGWGEEVVRSLRDAEVLDSIQDLYNISRKEASVVLGKGLGPKLIKERDDKRKMTSVTFLAALGIPGVGRSQAEKFLSVCTVKDALELAVTGDEDLIPCAKGLGVRWKDIVTFLADHVTMLSFMATESVALEDSAGPASGPFVGKKIVFTGRLTDLEREEARELVRTLGASTPSGVTKDTDYLVVGDLAKDEQRSKREKAEQYNAKGSSIKILSEVEFNELLASAMESAKTS